MRDVTIDRTVSNLGLTIAKKFGVAIEYNSAATKSMAFETARRNGSAPMIIAHNKMILPMRVDGILVGAVQVHDAYSLSGSELSQIKNSIESTLGEILCKQVSEKYSSNVIQFFDWLKPEVAAARGSWTRAFAMDFPR